MKISFASSLLWCAAMALSGPAQAESSADGQRCLANMDVPCAQQVVASLSDSTDKTYLEAALAFHTGEFARAEALMGSLAGKVQEDNEDAWKRGLALYQATRDATEGMVTARRGDVEVRYDPNGTDLVLVDEAIETLQAAHDRIGPLLGGAPPGMIRVEIYPTADRFIAASSLPVESVRRTGVVAISKWTRLLVTSPRALGRGYAWRDTLSHEYIHYIVAWRTKDLTPVWLQEGIARAYEGMWHADELSPLPPFQQTLLADALATDTLVTTEEIGGSIAFMSSADRAALAYAQLSTKVSYLRKAAGKDALARVLDRIRDGTEASQALADVATAGSLAAFELGWKADLESLHLVQRKLASMPTVLGTPTDDFAIDPVLSGRRDLAGHVRLGDLLMEAKRPDAALLEYQAGMPPLEPASPLLSARLARVLLALDREDEAIATLRASIGDYPDMPITRKLLGERLLARGMRQEALAEYRAGADVNPFDPDVQAALADLYAALGQSELAARHARYRRILDVGGAPLDGEDG